LAQSYAQITSTRWEGESTKALVDLHFDNILLYAGVYLELQEGMRANSALAVGNFVMQLYAPASDGKEYNKWTPILSYA